MKYGIIDIGSNTVRTVVYDCSSDGVGVILNETDDANLYDYIQDGVLSHEGIWRLVTALNEAKLQCRLAKSKNNAYIATAAVRTAKNRDAVIAEVKKECGVDVRLLSGKEEAYYDWLGLKMTHGFTDGAAFDLGGGSCQLIAFENGEVLEYASLPAGTRRIYNEYLSGGEFPQKEDIYRIHEGLKTMVSEYPAFKERKYGTLYAMGGTSRALVYLISRIHSRAPVIKDGFLISKDDLTELMLLLLGEYVTFKRIAKSVSPKRVNTLTSGVAELLSLCELFGASDICVLGCGVREGVLYEMMN